MLRLLEQGCSTKQIAAELHLSTETVRNHIRRLLQALGVHSDSKPSPSPAPHQPTERSTSTSPTSRYLEQLSGGRGHVWPSPIGMFGRMPVESPRRVILPPAVFGVVSRVKAIKSRTQTLVQLNIELAKLEGKEKATAVGIAGGLGAVAAVLLVYAVGLPLRQSPRHSAKPYRCGFRCSSSRECSCSSRQLQGSLRCASSARPRLRSRPRRSRRRRGRSRRCRAMSEKRGTAEIRAEIAAERQRLDADLTALQGELRSLVPLVVAGLAVVTLVTFRKSARAGLAMIWRLT